MSTVFLSYSPEDALVMEQLEAQLKNYPDISIWHDQEKIRGGEQWPKVLGKAIADQDVFLLAWSKNAATSPHVKFEWHVALTLGKTIVLCLLDETPVPPALTGSASYQTANIEGVAIALDAVSSTLDQTPAIAIEKQPSPMNTDSSKADAAAPSIPIASELEREKTSFIDKRGRSFGLAVGAISLLGSLVTIEMWLSDKTGFALFEDEDQLIEQVLSGSVQDASTNEPLDHAEVMLPEFGLTASTNRSGYFEFHVRAPKQDIVKVSAKRERYDFSEIHKQILGDRKVLILLKRQSP